MLFKRKISLCTGTICLPPTLTLTIQLGISNTVKKGDTIPSFQPYLPVFHRELGSVWHGVAEWPQCAITAPIVVRVKQCVVYINTNNLKTAKQDLSKQYLCILQQ